MRIEAGGEDDDVERVLGVAACGCPSGVMRSIGRGAHIHQRDVVAVEGLEVIGVDRRPLRRIGMVDVGQLRRGRRILHDLADLAA